MKPEKLLFYGPLIQLNPFKMTIPRTRTKDDIRLEDSHPSMKMIKKKKFL